MDTHKLNAKRERFCQEYIIDCNGTQAAIRAGYSEHTAGAIASENLTIPLIQQRLAELQEQIAKTVGLTAEYVIAGFMEVYERCMQKVPAMTNDDGSITGFTFNATGANRALELLGKHLDLFEDKTAEGPKLTIELILSAGDKGDDPLKHKLTGVSRFGENN